MSKKRKGSPPQVLEVMRLALMEHMDTEQYGPWYRPQTIVALGRNTGRIITEEGIRDGKDVEGALLIIMRDGSEYRLTLESAPAVREFIEQREESP